MAREMLQSRSRNKYELDIDAATAAIANMNSSPSMVASDRLLAHHFPDIKTALHSDTIAERVILVDALWGTRLFMENGASDRIARNLGEASGRLVELLSGLSPDDLTGQPERVSALAKEVLPVILVQEPGDPDKYRENYSFATKFFHWCTRHHFPIVDRWARKRINAWQVALRVRPRVRSDTAAMQDLSYTREYERWINFYSDLIFGLGPDNRERLVKADYDSQPASYRVTNSSLRVLDKVFYWQGGGRGLGRVVE